MAEELYTNPKYRSILIEELGGSPRLRIIDFFIDNAFMDFTKKEVIDALGMSRQTFYKYFTDVEKRNIVFVTRRVGRAKFYKLNRKNITVKALEEFITTISLDFAEQENLRMGKNVPAKAKLAIKA